MASIQESHFSRFINSRAGRYTNMNGKVNPTSEKRNAARPVCMIFALAIDALA